jgi:ribosomal protein L14E/L6E/L27E
MEIGTIVVSLAGRDKGRMQVVVRADEGANVGGYAGVVYVADGKEHKLCKPKRKNLKHIKATNKKIDTKDLTDRKLRKLFTGEEENG